MNIGNGIRKLHFIKKYRKKYRGIKIMRYK